MSAVPTTPLRTAKASLEASFLGSQTCSVGTLTLTKAVFQMAPNFTMGLCLMAPITRVGSSTMETLTGTLLLHTRMMPMETIIPPPALPGPAVVLGRNKV
uniref:Uncharacterized protein n=1 Tax=Cacopsylla melanoneura TaxID=428564 RepID=A0A8D8T2S2_9HEMI